MYWVKLDLIKLLKQTIGVEGAYAKNWNNIQITTCARVVLTSIGNNVIDSKKNRTIVSDGILHLNNHQRFQNVALTLKPFVQSIYLCWSHFSTSTLYAYIPSSF